MQLNREDKRTGAEKYKSIKRIMEYAGSRGVISSN